MTFFSLNIFFWLVGAAVMAWCLPKRFAQVGLIGLFVAFMVLNAPLSLAILAATACISYFVIRRLGSKTTVVVPLVVFLAAVLIWFKANHSWVVGELGQVAAAAVPLGISYYIFRQIHYVFEAYKKKLPPHTLFDYVSYLFFLPTLFAGPINLFQNFKRDMGRRRWDTKLFSRGLERILYGYAKIVILSNYLVSTRFVDWTANTVQDAPLLENYLDAIRYAANLYLQFSGYSDVVIGFSLIMGFRIVENFNYPYLAPNINEFWNRWHISLSSWCREYVYTPIASSTRRPLIAILISMVVLGLWHELSVRFLIWGVFHGVGIGFWHIFQKFKTRFPVVRNRFLLVLTRVVSTLFTLNFVIIGFIIVKEPSISDAMRIYGEFVFFWR